MADETLFSFVRDWLWAPAMGLVAWAWNRNEKEHEMLRQSNLDTRQDASNSHSLLMDKFVTHVDDRVKETLGYVRAEDKRLMEELSVQQSSIVRLFDKLEEHGKRSEDRHIETLKAIHNLADNMHHALSTKADK